MQGGEDAAASQHAGVGVGVGVGVASSLKRLESVVAKTPKRLFELLQAHWKRDLERKVFHLLWITNQ